MIILLDTSTFECRLTIVLDSHYIERQWQAERNLAKDLLKWLENQLEAEGKTFSDIEGIGAFLGPGSFTGLRIGLTVVNTLADGLKVPIVGTRGDDWKRQAVERLKNGENDKIALPYYGSDANITTPRK